jgi:multidrug resistance efflux pump
MTHRDEPQAGVATAARNGPMTLSDRVRSLRLPDRAEGGRGSWLPWVLCLLLAGSTGYLAWRVFAAVGAESKGGSASTPAGTSAGRDGKGGPAGAKKEPNKGALVLESKGYIIPVSLVQVSPKVGGMVMELNIEEGKWVKEGSVLAVLETTEYQKEYNRTKGMYDAAAQRLNELTEYRHKEIEQVRAELEDAKAQERQLKVDYERNLDLRRRGAVAEREYELARFTYDSQVQKVRRLGLALELIIKGPRDARIAAVRGELAQAQAEMEKAKWKLDNCEVRAPISGTILSKKAEKGNQVNPAAFSNGLSASLCEMADLTEMEVDLAIPDRDIAKVFKGQKCVVRAEAYLDRLYEGYVSRVMPIADRAKGALPVRVRILIPAAEEGQYLRPEMGALVTFYNQRSEHVGKSAPPPVEKRK